MNKILPAILLCFIAVTSLAQDSKVKVERACFDYIEGFYEGDTAKLIRCLKPSLYKIGLYKRGTADKHGPAGQMTYRQALDYAKNVLEKKDFAKPDSPKGVEVMDIMDAMAAVKVTGWWGYDYILLSKQDDKWMIEQVLWEGPLKK